jgi:8-hydroxy-5-deazaflavin:NADPH oxidoreductase
MEPKVGIIGHGHVGSALERGLERSGYEVRAVGHDANAVRGCGEWADVVVLAVPFRAVEETLEELGSSLDDKVLLDVTNALDEHMKLVQGDVSAAEEIQRLVPEARVVKIFNTVFANHMDTGSVDGESLTAFVAGDDPDAKETALEIARAIGFDAVDAGPLENARWLETLGYLNIQLGYAQHMGRDIGFKLVHPPLGV